MAAWVAGHAGLSADPDDPELAVARAGCALLDIERAGRDDVSVTVESLKRWCAARLADPAYRHWIIFRFPETVDYSRLVDVQRPRAALPEWMVGPDNRLRRRDGFTLTDSRMQPREILSEAHYCVLCHERDKDSCSKGLRQPPRPAEAGESSPAMGINPLGITLSGCPLDEKISEMHLLRRAGDAIGALALVMLDNPMCPGTGHRICNDCRKSCIYQKQEPVDIPEIETGVLTDVLRMPFGVEIYGLLTRWNPLNVRRPYALPYNGKNILVVGLGPAGYTLAHYLLNEGFGVVGIDGLKIEPLPTPLVGTPDAAAVADPRLVGDLPLTRRSRAGRLRRRVGIRHHRAVGQELSLAAASDPGPASPPEDLWRRPAGRHPLDRGCLGVRLRSRRHGDRRRAPDRASTSRTI